MRDAVLESSGLFLTPVVGLDDRFVYNTLLEARQPTSQIEKRKHKQTDEGGILYSYVCIFEMCKKCQGFLGAL